VQAGYFRGSVRGNRVQPGFFGQRVDQDLDYDSENAYIQLQQPLFDYSRYAEYKSGHARADLGEAEFAVTQAEAAIRLAEAYFTVVLAEERLRLNQALADSLSKRAKAQAAMYAKNEASRI